MIIISLLLLNSNLHFQSVYSLFYLNIFHLCQHLINSLFPIPLNISLRYFLINLFLSQSLTISQYFSYHHRQSIPFQRQNLYLFITIDHWLLFIIILLQLTNRTLFDFLMNSEIIHIIFQFPFLILFQQPLINLFLRPSKSLHELLYLFISTLNNLIIIYNLIQFSKLFLTPSPFPFLLFLFIVFLFIVFLSFGTESLYFLEIVIITSIVQYFKYFGDNW